MAIMLTKALLGAGIYGLFAVFFCRLYVARQKIYKLRRANLSMPEFSLVGGHFLVLGRLLRKLPSNCTIHAAFLQIARQFPNGLFYIDVWPYSRPLLIVTTPSAALQMQQSGFSKPPEICEALNTLMGGESLLTMVDAKWKRWRSLFNPGFSGGYMLGLVPLMVQEVAVFRELLEERAARAEMFQLEEMTLRLTLDIIGAVSMDTRLHYQTGHNELAAALRSQIEWTNFGTTLNPFKRYLSVSPIVRWYNNRRMNRYIHSEIDKQFKDIKIGSDKASKSVLSLALQDYIRNMPSENAEIVDPAFKDAATANLRLFLFAGHDTTSSTLIFCYQLLATHREVLSRMQSEHSHVFGKDRSTSHVRASILENPQRLNELPYTMAVIKETLRLNPPSSSIRVGRPGVDIIDESGQRYPTEGCNVFLVNPALHRNPNYWKEPDRFMPDRWLAGPKDELHPVEGAWRPFQLGPRSCIGQTLALMELRVALVMTIREFDVRPAYDEWDKLHPTNRVRDIDGNRVYPTEKGGGGAHPADGYPCRVDFLKLEDATSK